MLYNPKKKPKLVYLLWSKKFLKSEERKKGIE